MDFVIYFGLAACLVYLSVTMLRRKTVQQNGALEISCFLARGKETRSMVRVFLLLWSMFFLGGCLALASVFIRSPELLGEAEGIREKAALLMLSIGLLITGATCGILIVQGLRQGLFRVQIDRKMINMTHGPITESILNSTEQYRKFSFANYSPIVMYLMVIRWADLSRYEWFRAGESQRLYLELPGEKGAIGFTIIFPKLTETHKQQITDYIEKEITSRDGSPNMTFQRKHWWIFTWGSILPKETP
jgi:hypothetical protein